MSAASLERVPCLLRRSRAAISRSLWAAETSLPPAEAQWYVVFMSATRMGGADRGYVTDGAVGGTADEEVA